MGSVEDERCEDLEREVYRLREALKELAQLGTYYAEYPGFVVIARKALGCAPPTSTELDAARLAAMRATAHYHDAKRATAHYHDAMLVERKRAEVAEAKCATLEAEHGALLEKFQYAMIRGY